jgi:hypothetical protein
MAFQLSPGVLVSEVDATTVVPSVSTSIGGLAGASVWGPANNVVLISSESQFADTFGRPDANTYGTFFTAANFLAYGANFKFARSVGATATNAAGGGAGVQRPGTNEPIHLAISAICVKCQNELDHQLRAVGGGAALPL